MSALTLTVKKPLGRRITRLRNAAPLLSSRPTQKPAPSKRAIREFWAKAYGIVNTGETDLSTREGFGY